MQAFQITNGPPPGPKNYVFVDEHNRHKRLKVMRACEGCRRRKIKCDAATTNTWPCAACKRLKLPCVPPAGGLEFDQASADEYLMLQQSSKLVGHNDTTQFDQYSQFHAPALHLQQFSPDDIHGTFLQESYQYLPQHQVHESHYQFSVLENATIGVASQQSNTSPKTPDNQTAEILTEQLGELRIGENGVAPYVRQQHLCNEPDGPIQESEVILPPLSTAAGSQIRIPPALMPDDDDANESFHLFFENVHPYVPVLCRSQFFHQWRSDRNSISPLLLEALFACAGRISGDPVEESPWLALANKHEASFLDTPRLSTVQALLLLMKAREGSPKRGYFYKSWMTCKTALLMAKDLDLHEHYGIHKAGDSCESSPTECVVKTRIWQTIMVCELMIGAPQGRFDFGTDADSIDISLHPVNSDIDEYESRLSHQFAFFIRNALNIRYCAEAYVKVKRKKDWALDPIFDKLQEDFHRWPEELSEHLRLTWSPDESLPQMSTHFIGNMHSHYQLGIIMLHRPQLVALAKQSLLNDGQWRHNMSLCYQAAKRLCQIQEAVLAKHDMLGLLCMQRGMSYTVYSILTCIMLHLIAITSPDPEFNSDAREYFVRHMRLLERCMPEWPMPETDKQINNLRAAFSANLDRPFDLKPSFPFGSPSSTTSTLRRASEPRSDHMPSSEQGFYRAQQQTPHSQSHQTYFPTPPISNGNSDSKPPTPQFFTPYNVNDQNQTQTQPQYRHTGPTSYPQQTLVGAQAWNPSPIIDQFTTAFSIPASALQPPNPVYGTTSPNLVPSGIGQQQFTPSPQTPTYDLHAYARHQAQAQAEAQARAQAQAQTPQIHMQHLPPQLMAPPVQGLSTQQPQSSYFEANVQPDHNVHMTVPSPFPSETHSTSKSQARSPSISQPNNPSQLQMPGMVYVSAKEWQQSVASVIDPGGLKRRWTFDTQITQ